MPQPSLTIKGFGGAFWQKILLQPPGHCGNTKHVAFLRRSRNHSHEVVNLNFQIPPSCVDHIIVKTVHPQNMFNLKMHFWSIFSECAPKKGKWRDVSGAAAHPFIMALLSSPQQALIHNALHQIPCPLHISHIKIPNIYNFSFTKLE